MILSPGNHRAPLTLSAIGGHNLLFRPSVILQGLLAHVVAEAVLSAPQVLCLILLSQTNFFINEAVFALCSIDLIPSFNL